MAGAVRMTRRTLKRGSRTRTARAKSASIRSASPRSSPGAQGAKGARPIELYYWPTPNGQKIAIMLEECRLPYAVKPVNIAKGEQFDPAFLKISSNNRI